MTWPLAIAAVIALMALLAVTKLIRRLVFAFALAACGLLVLHMQSHPGEALAALGAMWGGVIVARPLRRVIWGGLF